MGYTLDDWFAANPGVQYHNGLDTLFKPRSIAVIGATKKSGSVGKTIIDNLFEFGFEGEIYPVNPKYSYIHSVKCYPNLYAIPSEVDLAILVINRDFVLQAIDDCIEKGIRSVVVISAGFKEVSTKGAELEAQLMEKIQANGMRLVGPNCLGVINTHPDIKLNATFAVEQPLPGPSAFISQSGALGVAIISMAKQLNLGLSYFVSLGNKADISGNNLLEYWEHDEQVKQILLYLESFGDPKLFMQLASRISKSKPILLVKSGRTEAGAKAVSSHTGSIAGADKAVDAMLTQSGVFRYPSIESLFTSAQAFASCPLPQGNRIAIVSNAGGPAVMATDLAISRGLKLAELEAETTETLKSFLPDTASVANPIDMIASASQTDYFKTVEAVAADPNVDGLIVIYVQVNLTFNVTDFLSEIQARYQKPVLGVVMAPEEVYKKYSETELKSAIQRIPLYAFPEAAIHAFSDMVKYREWQEKPLGHYNEYNDINTEFIYGVLNEAKGREQSILTSTQSLQILEALKIKVAPFAPIYSEEQLLEQAESMGYPVVLKVDHPKMTHKSDVGGVILNIKTPEALKKAYAKLLKIYNDQGILDNQTVLLQKMSAKGSEWVIGMNKDPKYGPMMMFGMGGVFVEVMKDVAFRLTPMRDNDAREMLQSIRAAKLLNGYRGFPQVNQDWLCDIILRLAYFSEQFENDISEIDINPLVCSPEGICAVDARMILG